LAVVLLLQSWLLQFQISEGNSWTISETAPRLVPTDGTMKDLRRGIIQPSVETIYHLSGTEIHLRKRTFDMQKTSSI
jgi:hypothetical protein